LIETSRAFKADVFLTAKTPCFLHGKRAQHCDQVV
jgi:hypothetical protein